MEYIYAYGVMNFLPKEGSLKTKEELKFPSNYVQLSLHEVLVRCDIIGQR